MRTGACAAGRCSDSQRAGSLVEALARGHGLDRDRLDHQAAVGHQEGKALPVPNLELALDGCGAAETHDQRGVGTGVAHVDAQPLLDHRARHALADQLFGRRRGQQLQAILRGGQAGAV